MSNSVQKSQNHELSEQGVQRKITKKREKFGVLFTQAIAIIAQTKIIIIIIITSSKNICIRTKQQLLVPRKRKSVWRLWEKQ